MSLFRKPAFLLLVTFSFLLILSRFTLLGEKPYHHDEAQYAMEAWKYAEKGTYQFNPVLHGPFLFHFHALLFEIFPDNDFTGRLPVVLFGVLLPFFLFPVLQKKNRNAEFLALLLLTLTSPILAYFSRFLGMDIVLAGSSCLLLTFIVLYRRSNRYWALIGCALTAGIMICTKLNFLFYFFIFLTYPAVSTLFSSEADSVQGRVRESFLKVKNYFHTSFVAAAVFLGTVILVYCTLYSSLFRHLDGIWDGFYGKMIPYWLDQHKIQRIKGPFDYYLPFLLIYEIPLLLAVASGYRRAVKTNRKGLETTLWVGLVAFILYFLMSWQWTKLGSFMDQAFHLGSPHHPSVALVVLFLWYFLLSFHFRQGEKVQAFAIHWAALSFLLYGYAGEKVPWLAVHIVLPLVLYSALEFSHLVQTCRKTIILPLVSVGLIWQGFNTIRTLYLNSANPVERIVFTHTTWDVEKLVSFIEDLKKFTGQGKNLRMQVIGDAGWPLNWYLRHHRSWFQWELQPLRDEALIVYDWENHESVDSIVQNDYARFRLKLRAWWKAEDFHGSINDWISYYFTRTIFGHTGSTDIAVYVRKDLERFWPYGNKTLSSPSATE